MSFVREKVTTQRNVDQNGEYQESTIVELQEFRKPETEPDYIKIYLNRLGELQGLPQSQNKVLFEIACRMPFADNTVQDIALNKYIKTQIAEKIGVSEQYVNDTITFLVKKGILIRIGRGTYQLNPFYIAKGKWANIKELQLKLIYNSEGEKVEELEILNKDGTKEIITK